MKHGLIVKSVFAATVFAFSSGVCAGTIDDMVLRFSTPGPDRYADGTIVPDGECYALVWSPDGKSFSGFNADGTAASALDRVVLAGPLALGGRCRDSLFQIDASYTNYVGGTWAVCLVDTRRANGVPAGVKDGKPVRVNRWGIVGGGVSAAPASASALTPADSAPKRSTMVASAGGGRASTLSKVPASLKQPTITELQVSDGVASLWVADTVDWLTYTIESSDSLGNFSKDAYADKCDGVGEGYEILLETDALGTTRFFRVTRAE